MNPLSLGFSPCPNDTFIFHALVHNLVECPVALAEPQLADVELLNQQALAGKLDITKLSFNALGHLLEEYCVLSAGAALGRGCGPLLITPAEHSGGISALAGKKIAIPGRYTTAALLLQMFLSENAAGCELVELRFDHIMDAVKSGTVAAGVIIHESRFTYADQGFVCLQDLGEWWERLTGTAIPLGCIAAKRTLGGETIAALERAIAASVRYAFAHPGESLPWIRQHSQELAPEVVQSHISLYVNNWSADLGTEGMAAIETFLERGRTAGVLPPSSLPVRYH
ncbi:1,4-dihydroxy-6-naphthoate synthase [Desulforhopalus vacuolatus]|uniref:1,4-dihydroxy-6-naphthoate synthase n=1 Tax=Desulforhopalus vacuolatus TaxID=40414 RepID=UPI0019652C0C|nr:1,4-dihydroxy-6-naphthoate synthase [Desulforhopalus vacuolatus]MBM9520150.1 1,4-dihydroxy-6-naphthoate synthase [Desulforhopalus vacuolatus]